MCVYVYVYIYIYICICIHVDVCVYMLSRTTKLLYPELCLPSSNVATTCGHDDNRARGPKSAAIKQLFVSECTIR